MSYCVNCGVELDKSAKKCALCGTRVINPNEPQKKENAEQTPFSEKPFVPAEIKRRFVAYVITMVMLIPNIVCTFLNAIIYKGSFWSFYVSTTSFLLWVLFVFPFYTKKLRPYLMWFLDTLGVCAYVFFFFVMGYEGKEKWYFSTALPIILSAAALTLFFMLWIRRKKQHSFRARYGRHYADGRRKIRLFSGSGAAFSGCNDCCFSADLADERSGVRAFAKLGSGRIYQQRNGP